MMRRKLLAAATLALLAACDGGAPTAPSSQSAAVAGTPVPMAHARTFSVVERDGYRVVDMRALVVNWGESAKGQEQTARLVLVPRGLEPPPLTGDLAGATVIRTPVQRLAVNNGYHEAIARALGIEDRLVAVGGTNSWDDGIHARVVSGEIAQIGYGWHLPPALDALIGARPDVLLMSLGDLEHAEEMRRINGLGIPVVPMFAEAEPTYMGRVDYVRLVGLLTGREREAEAFVAMVEGNVAALKAQAAALPRRSVLAAWFAGGDRWAVTMRNADAQLFRDVNAELVMAQPDDPRRDSFNRVGTEVLLREGADADCWLIRDTHSQPYRDVAVLNRFRAYREGCLFASDGSANPRRNAYELYETGIIRPDYFLGDYLKMLHPQTRPEPFRYLRPDTTVPGR